MSEAVHKLVFELNDVPSFFTHHLVHSRFADDRVFDWPFMGYPYKVIGMVIFYLLAVYILIPRYMEKRKPYELKTFIQCYNIFQVVFCALLAYRTLTSGWTTTYTLGCELILFSKEPLAIQMAGCFWWNMVIKAIEFIETIVFALRKKNDQISILHVYHHISTFFVAWCSCKYIASGMPSFGIILNCIVHILMYSYYFLASLGPEMQKKLTWVKPKLTIIQMTQLIILFCHTLQALSPNCDVIIFYPVTFLPILGGNIILFLMFYRNTYLNKKDQ